MLRREEFDVLEELRKTGPLPLELEQRHQKLRREQLFKAGLQADHYPPPSSSSLVDADMTIADWLRERWASADKTVRSSLRVLADALGIPLPMTRTRRTPQAEILINDKDSSPARRTRPARHPSQDDSDEIEEAEPKERGYHDRPAWDDNDADGWTPSESLYDALHPDDDRGGWY